MLNPSVPLDSSVNWRRLGSLPVIAAILLALVALPSPPVIPTRVHDTLQKLALSQPAAPVDVIVQRSTPDADLSPVVGRLGGQVIRELKLINAAVVTMPAHAVLELGRAAEVRWVSLDAPMADQTCQEPECARTSSATGDWIDAVKLRDLWQARPELQGQGVNIAVIDSGIDPDHKDLEGRIIRNVATHRNLVLNGSFDDGLSGWTADNGATAAQIVDSAFANALGGAYVEEGGHALFHPGASVSTAPVSMVQPINTFIPGTTYTLSAVGFVDGYDCDNWVGVRGVVNGEVWGTGFEFCEPYDEYKEVTFTVPEGTETLAVVTEQKNAWSDFLVDEIAVSPVMIEQDGGPVLVGVPSAPPPLKDLSAEGTVDWYHKGLAGDIGAVNRRSGQQRITVYNYGRFTLIPFDAGGTTYAWSNGTPTLSVEDATEGVAAEGIGRGFEVRAPALAKLRTLRVYLTLKNTELDVYGFLTDGSVLPYTDTSVDTVGYANGVRHVMYTFTYRASVNAQTFRVRFANYKIGEDKPAVVFHGATLSDSSALPVASNYTSLGPEDQYGHGTLMAGLIAGDGTDVNGSVVGVAPRAGLVNVRVIDANGEATVSDVIRGLEWVYQNRERYNIGVANISLNSSVAESHLTSPLSAAVEILWVNRIVVVVSAGNNGNDGVMYPPANDPLVITVGSVDHNPKRNPVNLLAPFSALGYTDVDNAPKPEIVAPGVNLIGAGCPYCLLNQTYTQNVPWEISNALWYFRASGTSLSAALVSGAAALVLQAHPTLDPDQVKYRLMSTGGTQFGNDRMRYLDVYKAVTGSSSLEANQNVTISNLLYTGAEGIANGSAKWGSAKWGSAKWGSAKWGSAKWGSTTLTSSLRGSVRGMSLVPSGGSSDPRRP